MINAIVLDLQDNYRDPEAYSGGGFPLNDQVVISKFRTAFKNLISQVGRQLLTGRFNLTNVSFPISCMSDQSILQIVSSVSGPIEPYLNTAAMTTDPVERMKWIIAGQFAYLNPCHTWEKPLNPILGETF